jgi:hypothetical protein
MDAKEARREWERAYRQKNAERVKEYQKKWRKAHPEKQREYLTRYWIRKAAKMNAEAARKGGTDQPDPEPSAE